MNVQFWFDSGMQQPMYSVRMYIRTYIGTYSYDNGALLPTTQIDTKHEKDSN